jgi:WD40 repeat protein
MWSFGGLCGDGSFYSYVGGDAHGKVHVFMFEAATGKELWRRPQQPSAMHFAADGKKVAVMSWDGDEYTLLNAVTGKEIQKLPVPSYRHDGNTLSAVSDDLHLAASARSWRNIELWELATGKKVRTLECPSHWTNGSLYFVPGSQLIVGAPERYFIHREKKGIWGRVWQVGTGRILQSFEEPILKMSADGRWLALQGDKSIVVRHLPTGRIMATLDGVPADADPMGFSTDGSLLAIRYSSWHELGLWDTFTGQQVCRWVDPMSQFQWLACSPDSRTLVVAVRSGGSMLVCDATGMATEAGKIAALELTPAEADRYWKELTSDDGPRSQCARWSMVAGGEVTVKMLQRSLRRVDPLDEKHVAALIAGLDSSSFKERQQSLQMLEKMELARSALEVALQRNPSLEVKRRIELILAKHDASPLDMESKHAMRGVLLLEQIGTLPARQHLQTLASGAAASLLTQEAQAALQRLAQAEQGPR